MICEQSFEAAMSLCERLFENHLMFVRSDLAENLNMLSKDESSPASRTIPKEMLDFIIDNFGSIYLLTIFYPEYRFFLLDVIDYEKENRLTFGFAHGLRNDCITIDLSEYSYDVYKNLWERIRNSFLIFKSDFAYINYELSLLDEDTKIEIGLIITNIYYIVRALAENKLYDTFKQTPTICKEYLKAKPRRPETEEELQREA